ncbi:MAG: glycosyltransferase family 39 protein, partial [Planctomycetota bacterium]
SPAAILSHCIDSNHPPLYFLILRYWILAFGDSAFSVRLLSVIFGFLALPVVYKISDLLFGVRTALLATLLTALSAFSIGNSQEARMYSLTVLLALLSIYFFIRLLEKKDTMVSAGYIFSTVLLLYTHYSGFFIPLVQSIFFFSALIRKKNHTHFGLRNWIVLQIALLGFYVSWITQPILAMSKIVNNPVAPAGTSSFLSIIEPLRSYSGTTLLLSLFVISLFAAVIPVRNVGKESSIMPHAKKVYFLLLWLFIPITTIFIMSRYQLLYFLSRYTAISAPPFYILAAAGTGRILNRRIRIPIVYAFTALSLIGIGIYFDTIHHCQWRKAAGYINSAARSGDVLIFDAGYLQENIFDYYSTRTDLIKMPFPERMRKVPMTMREKTMIVQTRDIEDIKQDINQHPRIWLILCYSRDEKGLMRKMLSAAYNEIDYRRYLGIEVFLFARRDEIETSHD